LSASIKPVSVDVKPYPYRQ